MSPSIELLVLGPIEIDRAGVRTPVTSRLQRRLLTALVVADGRTVSVDALAEALWDDGPPPSARNTLQSHVTRVRDLLGDPLALLTRSPGYALDRSRVATDADRFADEVRTARQAAAARPADAVALLHTALARWRGEPFGDDGGPAATAEVERLRQLHLTARRALAAAEQAAGDLGAALQRRAALHEADPLREEDATALAELLARTGRVPEALDALRRHRRALVDELGLDPGPAVATLEQRLLAAPAHGVLARPAPSPPAGAPGSLTTSAPPPALAPPRVPTTFGRDEDLARLTATLDAADVVTIVGPGGVGKTHLAALVAGRHPSSWFDLTRLRSPEHLHAALADALGARPGPGRSLEAAVIDALRAVPGTVVLDNCEHLLDAVAELVAEVDRAGPGVRILATSRERLDVPGEQVVRLDPLPVPAPEDASEDDAAVALFQHRLVEAGGRPVTAAEAGAVVTAVDGLPLALELAAARAVALPVPTMVAQLRDHLDLLARSRPRPRDRHARLADVIAWSHDLLDDAERTLYRRLAVFAATFRVTDARAVCGAPPLDPAAVPAALGRLVERSMVVRVDDDRYRLLEPLRLDAAARLDASEDRAVVEERQRGAVLAFAARAGAVVGRDPGEVELLHELPHALADVRAVHSRARASGDHDTCARLVVDLHRAAYVGARVELLRWARPLVDVEVDTFTPDVRAHLVATAATAAWMAGQLSDAEELVDQLRGVSADDDLVACIVAETIGDVGLGTGALEEATAAYVRAGEAARAAGEPALDAQQRAGIAIALVFAGQASAGAEQATSALSLAERAGVPTVTSLCSYALGEALADVDPDQALARFARARETADRLDARLLAGIATTAETALLGRHGDPSVALTRYQEVLGTLPASGADGIVLTALRNLVVLLVRTGRDRDALHLADGIAAVGAGDAYGGESARLEAALDAARIRQASAPHGGDAAVAAGPDGVPTLVEDARRAVAAAIAERTA